MAQKRAPRSARWRSGVALSYGPNDHQGIDLGRPNAANLQSAGLGNRRARRAKRARALADRLRLFPGAGATIRIPPNP